MSVELTDNAIELVCHKAKQLVGKMGYTVDDLDDIQQELTIELLGRLPQFDSAKASYNTFVTRAIDSKICKMLRDRQAELRDHQREVCSLNDDINTGETDLVQRYTTFSQDEVDIRMGRCHRPAEDRERLRFDIETVLEELPVDVREAVLLLKTFTPTQAAREMGIPQPTFHEKYLVPLREAFAAKGLAGYCV